MIISVLERRSETACARPRRDQEPDPDQFLAESILLAAIGGVVVCRRAAATVIYASSKNWTVVIPRGVDGGIASAILIGASPADAGPPASRMPPTVALRTA